MTAALAIPDIAKADDVAAQAVATAQQLATALKPAIAAIGTPETAQWAVDTAKQIREQKRALEAERDKVAKPLRKLASDHTKRWKPAIDMLDALERELKGAVLAFQTAERERQAAALQAATSPAEVAQAVAVLAPKPEGLSERVVWAWEIEDQKLIPLDYFVLDTARLDRETRQLKGALEVPGIRVVRKMVGVLR